MPRIVRQKQVVGKKKTRQDYKYFAYPLEQANAFDQIILKSAAKYGHLDRNNVIKNLLGEFIVYLEKESNEYIPAREWAYQHWNEGKHAPLSGDGCICNCGKHVLLSEIKNIFEKDIEKIKKIEEEAQRKGKPDEIHDGEAKKKSMVDA